MTLKLGLLPLLLLSTLGCSCMSLLVALICFTLGFSLSLCGMYPEPILFILTLSLVAGALILLFSYVVLMSGGASVWVNQTIGLLLLAILALGGVTAPIYLGPCPTLGSSGAALSHSVHYLPPLMVTLYLVFFSLIVSPAMSVSLWGGVRLM